MLNDEQQIALEKITHWLYHEKQNFFLLKGSAGTGKTFCIRELSSRGGMYVYTAPTNKATKVISESVSTDGESPTCMTIYSLLGLTMDTNEDIKVLKDSKRRIDLSMYTAIVVDEASMINKQLYEHIEMAAIKQNARFIFMGDPAQLNPVKEQASRVWEIGSNATLTKVMRHDNAILDTALKIRAQVDERYPKVSLVSNNDGTEGVWRLRRAEFEAAIKVDAQAGLFTEKNKSKIIAWRNRAVLKLNDIVRNTIFPNSPTWVPGDRVVFASAIKGVDETVLATIDDEGTVLEAVIEYVGNYKAWALKIQVDDSIEINASVIHTDSIATYKDDLERLRDAAKEDRSKWRSFWFLKEFFNDIRYAYAITAHRAQGSTYETAYVCWQDMLLNHNVNEAYRCLYVAATRPKKKLIFS